MRQKFRLFVQKHHNGAYTVILPGIDEIELADPYADLQPANPCLSASGIVLDEVKDSVVRGLERWLGKVAPATLSRYTNFRESQSLEKVDVELRPTDRRGKKRSDRLRLKVSLLVSREEDGQYLVIVPKLTSPRLSFYCYNLEEMQEVAARELAAYFSETSLEDMVQYQYQRQEFLDSVDVSFTPLAPDKEKKDKEKDDSSFWALKASGVNLTARVREKKLLRAYRRDREVNEILNVLASDRNNSIILTGKAGSGKTAIIHEVVRRIADENSPLLALRKRQVWLTTADQLIAGCSYIGEWQEKLQNIVDEVKKRRHILVVDDIGALAEAGRWAKGDENMAQFLKPYIADGTIVILGESTPERLQTCENVDPGFLRLFRTLALEETSEDTTLSILGSVGASLEREFNLRIDPGALEAAVQLTGRFQPYRSFPGKAVSFLEQTAADAGKTVGESRPVISRQAAVSAFARSTGLPEMVVSDHLTLDPAVVERFLEERLIGQRDALDAMVDLVTVVKAGLNDPNKPMGVFFFVGPTGVGKTEMAKTLAEFLFGSPTRMIRFDMSEYAEPLSAAKLIGSAHGRDDGEMTRRIRAQPFSVVLLDEFEKANPDIYDVMLQVFGEGRLTDSAGRTCDFRSSIVIMTSNLGASASEQRTVGLRRTGEAQSLDQHFRQQVEAHFRPEFVNRIDRVVAFRPLDEAGMRQIARREIAKLLEREGIRRRSLLVEIEEDVIDLLLETGFSSRYGARPLKREIERVIVVPLARYLVANRVSTSQLIRVSRDGKDVGIAATRLIPAAQRVQQESSPLAADGGSRRLDLSALIEGIAGIRLRLDRWKEGETAREIRTEWRKLLAVTRQRDFVQFGESAHATWQRIYHLERILKRLDQLVERAEYLEEFATLLRRQRDTRSLPELAKNYTELARDADYLEIEILCAHLKEHGQALLRLSAVGRTADRAGQTGWMLTLVGMYLRWAQRKGYGMELFVPTESCARWLADQGLDPRARLADFDPGPPVRPEWSAFKMPEMASLFESLAPLAPTQIAFSLKGVNVYGFLKGEMGAHKILLRSEDSEGGAPFHSVEVRVTALGEEETALKALNPPPEEDESKDRSTLKKAQGEAGKDESRTAGSGPKPSISKAEPEHLEIIRLYTPEGLRMVRDLRTGVQTTQVKDVLDGHIDEFILAYLRMEEPKQAWEE